MIDIVVLIIEADQIFRIMAVGGDGLKFFVFSKLKSFEDDIVDHQNSKRLNVLQNHGISIDFVLLIRRVANVHDFVPGAEENLEDDGENEVDNQLVAEKFQLVSRLFAFCC